MKMENTPKCPVCSTSNSNYSQHPHCVRVPTSTCPTLGITAALSLGKTPGWAWGPLCSIPASCDGSRYCIHEVQHSPG